MNDKRDLSRLHKDQHAKFLLAVEEARDPDELFETFVSAWPADEGQDLSTLRVMAQVLSEAEAEAAEANEKAIVEHFAILSKNRQRVDAAKNGVVNAARAAYIEGATGSQIAKVCNVSLSSVNNWVAGARRKDK